MTRLVKALEELRISVEHEPQLIAFTDLFRRWNQRINLSAARSSEEVLEQVLDSLHVIPHLLSALRVLDVGSGGGFPVVIAAICLPGINFVGLEPVHKKHAFLRTAARELALVNFEALAQRLEDHESDDYDVAMSRATFELGAWLTLGHTRVRPGGTVIGFEALERTDVLEVERHPYGLGDKTRAIILHHRSP